MLMTVACFLRSFYSQLIHWTVCSSLKRKQTIQTFFFETRTCRYCRFPRWSAITSVVIEWAHSWLFASFFDLITPPPLAHTSVRLRPDHVTVGPWDIIRVLCSANSSRPEFAIEPKAMRWSEFFVLVRNDGMNEWTWWPTRKPVPLSVIHFSILASIGFSDFSMYAAWAAGRSDGLAVLTSFTAKKRFLLVSFPSPISYDFNRRGTFGNTRKYEQRW